MQTMGDVAHMDENLLYRVFGIDAELLIDHAWGRETATIPDIKGYKPSTNCLTSGQVLGCEYSYEKGKLVVKEMADILCLDLVDKGLVAKSITLHISYENALKLEQAKGTVSLRER